MIELALLAVVTVGSFAVGCGCGMMMELKKQARR